MKIAKLLFCFLLSFPAVSYANEQFVMETLEIALYKDQKLVIDRLDPEVRESTSESKILKTLDKLRTKALARGGIVRVEMVSEKQTEQGLIRFEYFLHFGNNSKDLKEIYLKKKNDSYLISAPSV